MAQPGAWEEVIAVATALLDQRKLTAKEAAEVIRRAMQGFATTPADASRDSVAME